MLVLLALAAGGTLQGVVRAEGTGEPIPRATVRILELGRTAVTDARGFYVLPDVPAGSHRVEARALGHVSAVLTLRTDGAATLRLDFDLVVRPVRLPGVDVRTAPPADSLRPPPADAGPAATRMPSFALRTTPGVVEPDVLRALQILPAVAAISDYSAALYVRGGSADQTLITLDGVPLFNPYHLGGIFSALVPDAVAYVDMRPGALPAALGDRLSGAVTIQTRSGARDRVRGRGAVGLISSHGTVDGPLPGGRGTFLLTGRRTYLDAVSNAAYGLGITDVTVPYGFWDVLGRATYPVGEQATLTFTGILNREGVHIPERMRREVDAAADFNWGSRMAAVGLRRPLGRGYLLDARVGYTDFSGGFDAWSMGWSGNIFCDMNGCDYSQATRDSTHVVEARTGIRDVVAGADITRFGLRHTLRTGFQVDAYAHDNALLTLDDFDSDYLSPFDQAGNLATVAAYVEDEWHPSAGVQVRGGLRVLHAGRLGTAWLPRVGARWQANRSVALSAGAGLYAQAIRSMKDDEAVTASLVAYDIFATRPEEAGLARSADAVLGVEYQGQNLLLRAEGYARALDGLVMGPEPDDPLEVPPLVVDDFRSGRGTAHGVELTGAWRAWSVDFGAAYALAWTRRTVHGTRFVPRFDRRHRVDLTAGRPWGGRGLLTARLALATGQPYTPVAGLTPPLRFRPGQAQWEHEYLGRVVLGEHNSARLPGYLRLDLAARRTYERRWFGRALTLTPYLQVVNVLNTHNALMTEPQLWGGPQLKYWPEMPILPSVGVEWQF